ncbi:DUF1353 domain-containing protein [Mesorhizobium xinjiangense]|uniref:DUF1353 domain-containing protein n=1 Tax=Mesorhizobium xinjiangense TaxID=2678685 RepID=UPI0012ED8D59|nr:DUF1353 domain-containing protein [Mesorhizobium xinjiangense]
MAAHFTGNVSVTWLSEAGDDRSVKLNQDFTFVDGAALAWTAKKNAVVDGASIPQIFWTTFGPPFVGDYRRASVVHDYFCTVRTRSAEATHRMFYEACRAGGVGETRAQLMYAMVRTFGPNWRTASGAIAVNGVVVLEEGAQVSVMHSMSDIDFHNLLKWIETEAPGIEAIDAEIDRRAQEIPVLPPPQERPPNAQF